MLLFLEEIFKIESYSSDFINDSDLTQFTYFHISDLLKKDWKRKPEQREQTECLLVWLSFLELAGFP